MKKALNVLMYWVRLDMIFGSSVYSAFFEAAFAILTLLNRDNFPIYTSRLAEGAAHGNKVVDQILL